MSSPSFEPQKPAGIRRVVLVSSGKGGVGKSTVTANLAVVLSHMGYRIGIFDADVFGPSIPSMFNVFAPPKVFERKLIPPERHGVRLLSSGMFGNANKSFVWSGPLLRGALTQMLFDTDWGELDYLLIDMPPGTGEVVLTVLNTIQADGTVLVTTPQNVALADVRRGLDMYSSLGVRPLVVVENMAFQTCMHCNEPIRVFPGNAGQILVDQVGNCELVSLELQPIAATSLDGGTPSVVDHQQGNRFYDGVVRIAEAMCNRLTPVSLPV